jgi:hypothetical protein
MVRRLSIALAVSLWFMLSVSFANANPLDFLNFNYLKNGQQVGNFYDGGSSNPGVPNLGVTFSSSFYGLHSEFSNGGGAFLQDVTQTPIIFMEGATGSQVTGFMNVAGGFTTGIDFIYTAAFQQTATIWSGTSGTGTVLATISLAANDASCSNVGYYCNWSDAGVRFSGTAKSVTFSGPANTMGLTDITLGNSATAIPEPSSIYLLGIGIAGCCAQGLRRFLKA